MHLHKGCKGADLALTIRRWTVGDKSDLTIQSLDARRACSEDDGS